MPLIYAAGDKANILERLDASQITMTNSNASYPPAALCNRAPCSEARFASAGADRAVTVDIDLLQTKGDMEGAGAIPAGWTDRSTGGGTATRNTLGPHGGTAQLRLDATSGVAAASRDFLAVPGERFIAWSSWVNSDGAVNVGLRLQDLRTGKFLTSAGAWQLAAANFAQGNSAAYADVFAGGPFVAALDRVMGWEREPFYLRLTLLTTGAVVADVDDVAVGVVPDVMTIHGHTVPPEITVEWRHSTDGVVGTSALLASAVPYLPSFGFLPILTGAYSDRRYQHFKVPGTPSDGSITSIGELGLWSGKVAARSMNQEPQTEVAFQQVRNVVGRHTRVHRQGKHPARVFRFGKRMISASEWQTIREDLLACQGGAHPILWIPDTNAPAPMAVAYCVIPAAFTVGQPLPTALGVWDVDDLVLEEQPFPNRVL